MQHIAYNIHHDSLNKLSVKEVNMFKEVSIIIVLLRVK